MDIHHRRRQQRPPRTPARRRAPHRHFRRKRRRHRRPLRIPAQRRLRPHVRLRHPQSVGSCYSAMPAANQKKSVARAQTRANQRNELAPQTPPIAKAAEPRESTPPHDIIRMSRGSPYGKPPTERAYSTEETMRTIDTVAKAKPISEEAEGSVRSLGRLSHRTQPQGVMAGKTTYSTP